MTLLRKIMDAAISSDQPISDLLRNCKVLAVRIGSQDLSQWVERELNGYPDKESLPDYRIVPTQSAGDFSGPFGSGLKNAPIPLLSIPETYHDFVSQAYLRDPVSVYVDLLGKEDGTLRLRWNPNITAVVGRKIYQNMNCMVAWQLLPRGALVGIVDAVRNRVLNFALELEKMNPDAGEKSGEAGVVSEKVVSHVFHTVVNGNVGNIASGNQSVSQSADVKVAQGDVASLRSQLMGLGFERKDVDGLETAIVEDSKKGAKEIGGATWKWIGGALAKAGQGGLKLTAATASSVLSKMIAQYLGFS
ncbi:hypothetical protein [Corallococcus sp. AB030]|uniref:AbiTii domain-containing protein n=1 Tax=Corallococcus TaxID=83461 RepID=UPI001F2B6158|nr:hypothetical protein [Corallococcus sp. AB030]